MEKSNTSNLSKPKPRGIIVVDACALIHLSSDIPYDFLTQTGKTQHPPPRLSDALFYLAEHGYQLVIPEMAAYEAGEFLRDGKTIHRHFDTKPAKHTFVHMTKDFFNKNKDSRYSHPLIQIEPALAEDHSEDAEFLRNLYALHTDTTLPHHIHCNRIADLMHKVPPRGAGERAALRLIHSFRDPDVPIFFLSDDARAGEMILKAKCASPLNILGTGGLFEAFHHNNLLPAIGIKSTDFHTIGRKIMFNLWGEPCTFSGSVSRIDMAQGQDSKNIFKPFDDNLSGLKNELAEDNTYKHQGNEAAMVVSEVEQQGRTAADKFRDKYANWKNNPR